MDASLVRNAKATIKIGLSIGSTAVLWSGGKDSTAMLHLIMQVCDDLGYRYPDILFIDHNDHFDEIIETVHNFVEDNGLYMVVSQNKSILDMPESLNDMNARNKAELQKIGFNAKNLDLTLNSYEGNHLLKTVPMIQTIADRGYRGIFVGIRRSENRARSQEKALSKRENPLHVRIHPMLEWSEDDVWSYIKQNKIVVPELYRMGYRSLDGAHSSFRLSSDPAWLQDKNIPERAGRSQDKEGMMEKLRQWGYM